MVAAELLGESVKEHAPVIFNLSTAFVGFEAAVALQDFIKTYEAQVTVENILDDGQIDRTKDFGINDHSALVEKMEATEVFKAELPTEQIANLGAYFLTLPSEVAMKLWTVLGNGELNNTVALHQCEVDGVAVSAYIVELLTGQTVS